MSSDTGGRARRTYQFDLTRYRWSERARGNEIIAAFRAALKFAESDSAKNGLKPDIHFYGAVTAASRDAERGGRFDEPSFIPSHLVTHDDENTRLYEAALREVADNEIYWGIESGEISSPPGSKPVRAIIKKFIIRLIGPEGSGTGLPPTGGPMATRAGGAIRERPVAEQVRHYLERYPHTTNKELQKLFPESSPSTLRARRSEFLRSLGEPVSRTGKAKKQTPTDAVREFLRGNPKATNKQLYEAFPNLSHSRLRALKGGK